MSRDDNIVSILASIGRLTREFNATYEYPFAGFSLSKPQIEVLFVLSRYQPLTVKQIAEALHVTGGGATQIINSLEELGFVVKASTPYDRRIRRVSLSQMSEQELSSFQKKYIDVVGGPFRKLTPGELIQLNNLLEKVKEGKDD